jgi:hypothetical protein
MTIFKAPQKSVKLSLVVVVSLLATLAFAVTPALAEFGLQRFAIGAQNPNGTPDVQAGSHPYALTTTFLLNGISEDNLKDVRLELPPGFVGDPNATPKCSYQTFITLEEGISECSNETAVGISTAYTGEDGGAEVYGTSDAVYNLVPPKGVAAEFGFIVAGSVPVLLDTGVRTGDDYGLTTTVTDVNQGALIVADKVTIWGVPEAPAHNLYRGSCIRSEGHLLAGLEEDGQGLGKSEDELEGPDGAYDSKDIVEAAEGVEAKGGCATQAPQVPLLTNPTSCGAPRAATLSVDDWKEPGNFATEPGNLPGEKVQTKSATLPELQGCESLDFSPTIGVKPDSEAGSTPSGLNVNLDVPQEATENHLGTAEADVKDTTVTLPPGVQLSPSAADGLQACSNAQIGYTGLNKELNPSTEPGVQTPQFKEKVYNPANGREEATLCPDASKIATVKIKTPLLEGELEGSVFLAAPQNFAGLPENPFSSLVAMYLVAEEPKAGVIVKLPGQVELGEAGVSNGLQPGQIRTTFDNTPQLPFSELKLEFYGTNRAPLATPAFCGTYETEASLTPWTAGVGSNSSSVDPSSSFNIETGPNGSAGVGGCPSNPLPFSPSLASGTTNNNAGSFSDLTTTLGREDGQQNIQSVTLHYPAGVSGILTGVPLCGEAEANAGTCSSGSEIGETIVSVGLGGDPFSVTGGKVYLTGPYDGAPFGLSIVNPAKAGPFDLQEGRPVVVRAKIEIDPFTAALTVTTDGSGAHAIPKMIEGIPLQIKHVNVNITRQGFTFNPTSCNPAKVEGTVNSAEGASSPVSVPFQVTNCAGLKFTPKFAVSTTGHTSKKLGAGLTAKVTEPVGALGTQANIARVKVDLPIKLPSQLKTLQKACPAKTFEEGFEKCLEQFKHSKVGEATVYTPILPVPLKGPAIFVSHGGEAFPSLTIVLQGYGVTVDLVGATDIKNGITSTTFKTVPDVPFTSFELNLPQGEFAALASNLPEKDKGNLCGQNLKMPTEFLAQNGAKINEDTQIGISGCAKAKALTRAQKLQKSIKACRKDKSRAKRARCEATARKQYGPVRTKKKGSSKKK